MTTRPSSRLDSRMPMKCSAVVSAQLADVPGVKLPPPMVITLFMECQKQASRRLILSGRSPSKWPLPAWKVCEQQGPL